MTYLIDAMSLISKENIHLFIVGDGELRTELENKVYNSKEKHFTIRESEWIGGVT